jgi:hypothetical protein
MKGKPRIARELFVAAAREDAMRSAEPWLKAAESSFWAGEERLAMADLSRLRRDAGDQLHYRAYGDALESRIAESSGDHRRATRLLRRATRTMPWDRALGYQLVKLYERTGDEDRARALGEKLDSGAP